VTAGFKVTEVKVFAPDAPGQVVAQDPAAGAKASKGAAVRINVSKGTGVVIVPNVVGTSIGDAQTRLAQAGLKGVIQLRVPSAQTQGTVVAQQPPGGQARRGSSVQLNVSDGTGAASATTTTPAPTTPTSTTPTTTG
jgi:beta-lactam-binding protein with PASTA domain